MNQMLRTDPIVIVGMHRSGTSLISRILEDSGVFMGVKKEKNNESIPFLRHNERVLSECGLYWHSLDIDSDMGQSQLFSARCIVKIQKEHGLTNEINHWGWKDPRTTLLMNEYLSSMPDAKFVHIYRNPYDVIKSLVTRQKEYSNMNFIRRLYNRSLAYCKFGTTIHNSHHLISEEHSFMLWKKYLNEAFDFNGNIFHIKYEDLLYKQDAILANLSKFLNLSLVQNHRLKQDSVYSSFTNNDMKELISKYDADSLVIKLGYSKDNVLSQLNG